MRVQNKYLIGVLVVAVVAANVICFLLTGEMRKVHIERIFGLETHGGVYKHPVSIAELANGDFYIAYHGGGGEYQGDTAVYGSRLLHGSTTWTVPQRIADTPGRGEGNAVIWQEPEGATWLFYVTRYGDTWSESIINYKYSLDYGYTWTDSVPLTTAKGRMVRSQPIQLMDGDFLLPVDHEVSNDPEFIGAESASLFVRYQKKTRQWTFSNEVHSRLGNIQPAAVQLSRSELLAYCRRGGGYEGQADGFIVKTESHDGGNTWAPGVDTSFPNPNSAIDLIKLKNSHLVMAYNDSNSKRNPLVLRVSTDNGKTWPKYRTLLDQPEEEEYPYIIQAKDGRIHGVFTSHGRTVINHFVIHESEIK